MQAVGRLHMGGMGSPGALARPAHASAFSQDEEGEETVPLNPCDQENPNS